MPVEDFGKASDKIVNGERITVPGVVGQPVDQAKQTLDGAGLHREGRLPEGVRRARPGSVAETNPGPGSRVEPRHHDHDLPEHRRPADRARPSRAPANTPNPTITGFPNAEADARRTSPADALR